MNHCDPVCGVNEKGSCKCSDFAIGVNSLQHAKGGVQLGSVRTLPAKQLVYIELPC